QHRSGGLNRLRLALARAVPLRGCAARALIEIGNCCLIRPRRSETIHSLQFSILLRCRAMATADRQWFIVSRWQEYEGEIRANFLRLLAVACFYAVEMWNYYIEKDAVTPKFHTAVTVLAVVWTMLGLGIFYCLHVRIFPLWLKYISTGGDIVLLTAVLMV